MVHNEYILGGFDLQSIGFIPGHHSSESDIAIAGHMDLSARTGKTHHVWPETKRIEPYVRPEEIMFSGRDITITGHVLENLRTTLYENLEAFNEAINAFEGEQLLECKWFTGMVTVKNFVVDRLGGNNGHAKVVIHLREAVPNFEGSLPATASGGYGIDGYSWADLGLIKLKTTGELNRAESRKLEVSVYGFEKNRVKFHEPNTFDLSLFVRKNSYEELQQTIQNFAHLLASPYRRMVSLEDGSFRECFAKDGFKVSDINVYQGTAKIDVKLTEIERHADYNVAGDNDDLALGDSTGEAFLILE